MTCIAPLELLTPFNMPQDWEYSEQAIKRIHLGNQIRTNRPASINSPLQTLFVDMLE